MKKLKIERLSPTPLLVILAVFVLAMVPIRVDQLINCIDPETGFWVLKDASAIILYVLGIVFFVIAFFFSKFSGVMTAPKFKEAKDPVLGACSILFIISLIVETALQVSKAITLVSALKVSTSTESILTYLTSTGAIAVVLEAIFGVLSIIYFVFVAISAFTGEDKNGTKELLGLTPVLWVMSRLIYHFVNPVNYRNVSQLFLEIILFCFAMVFFLSFARIASDVNGEKSMWLLWFTGTCTALFGYVCALAPVVLMITGKAELIPANYPVRYCDLGLAIFATAFLFTVTPLTNEVGED